MSGKSAESHKYASACRTVPTFAKRRPPDMRLWDTGYSNGWGSRRNPRGQRGIGGAARWKTGLMARPDWMRETPGMRVSTSSMKRW
jgi:hypothetical protein